MIRWISLIILIFNLGTFLPAQDVFNLENSRKFANYLYESGQFDLAADEYERVVFLEPQDSTSILKLLSAYRFEKKYDIGLKRAFDLLPHGSQLNLEFLKEIFLMQSFAGLHKDNLELVTSNSVIDVNSKNAYMLSAMMLDKNWGTAHSFYNEQSNKDQYFNMLGSKLEERNNMRTKNPYLAASMSVVIPGLGKVYTRDWQDGLIALLFVGTNAWQAYRGFNQDGVKSTTGWIFGSIGAGFWLGNIYGSYRSAKKYNERRENSYYDQVSNTIHNRL